MTTQPSGPGPEPERPTESAEPPGPRPTESAEPPGPRPTGPPSGPLSGGRQGPPPSPPAPPTGGPPPGPPPSGPWWRSVPRLATALVAVAALVALVVVLTRPGGSPSARGEVFLQPAAATGPDPFTESTAAREAVPPPQSPAPSPQGATPSTGATATRSISGAAPGLYGGTRSVTSCDVDRQIRALSAEPAKNGAFASALGIRPQSVPAYLRSLTPVRLRTDTRVTNHGYRDGKATGYQAVLQAGTAVLIDDRGVPRVRCACGNPLGPPVALPADPKRHGRPWSSYQPSEVVVIAPSETVVHKFVIYDPHDRRWFERDRGDHRGEHDKPVPPPVLPPATATPSPPAPATSTAPASPPASSHSPAGEAPASPPPPTSPPPSGPPSEPASKPASEPASPASEPASKEARKPASEPPPGSRPDTGTPSARSAAP
ncbi:DUF6777 domain-containing protein [Streptomyces roseus]|uniref:DUF6777 domain-containing protein n=1 Tax=Streptomyces roseus TaxID=66430 RepID=UPI000B08F4E4|nr:DUF6777 domain-containing protein [Streptomyces roseus]